VLRLRVCQNIRPERLHVQKQKELEIEKRNNADWASVELLRVLQVAWAAGNHLLSKPLRP
jgi:hypothetical protein